jgi:peroxiredoxin
VNALYEEFKGRGLALLLVNMGEDGALVRHTVRKRGYTAPVLLDAKSEVTAAYRVTGTPTVYLIDRRSQIIGRAIGRREWAGEEGRQLLARLLRP